LEDIAARWDGKAADWDCALENPACHLNEDDAYQRFLKIAQEVIESRRPFCARHGVIDVGCGTGLVLARFSSCFAWSVGLDVSGKMLAAAAQKKIPTTKFVRGDAFKLPTIASPAGAVLSRGVLLSHYGEQQGTALLKSCKDVLVAGGFLLFDFLNAETQNNFQHRAENKVFFAPTQVKAMALCAGFSCAAILGEPERRVLLLLAELA
jgi:predicted TPR repeat methyltransferase